LRRACIDIGSNTTRLLVADCAGAELVECRQERAFTQIGRSLDTTGAIPETKLAEVVSTVAAQLAIARELGAGEIRCVATAGVRRASNGALLAELIGNACGGLIVEILTGAQEARLAFKGAAWAARAIGAASIGVVDAGGGSSELVVGSAPDDVQWWESVQVGSGDVTVRWLGSDPVKPAELESARDQLRQAFSSARPPKVQRVIAVGGSATSLRTLAGPVLDADVFGFLFAAVQRLPAAELATRFQVDVQRARLLAGGLLILEAASEAFGVPLELGGGGLREGLLLDAQGYQ
jgi:exopolyphosphatase / guanosine-5'-triphosphate,3'-diphosphate pyrophosphatase